MARYSAFGALLRRQRQARGLTQRELAQRTGISMDAISALECGKRRNPHPYTIEQLADGLALASAERTALRLAARPPALAWVPRISPDDDAHHPPTGNHLGAMPRGPLVGRAAAVAQATAAMEAAFAGTGRTVVVAGEPGIGKTRLAQTLWQAACARGALVVGGTCLAMHTAVAFAPFQEMLTAAVAAAPAALRAAIPEQWPAVLRLLPGQPLQPTLARTGLGTDDHHQFLWQVTALCQALAAHVPLALFLDDLLWSDASSLALWHHLARFTHSDAIFLLGTYRSTELHLRPDVQAVLHALDHAAMMTHITLAHLAPTDTTAMITSILGQTPAPAVSATLHARSDGNPLFVRELLATCQARDLFLDGDWRSEADQTVVPESVQELACEQMARLSKPTQAVVQLASVLGQIARVDDLVAAHGGNGDAVEAALAEAEMNGIVQLLDAEHVAFQHALCQEAVYLSLGARRQREGHRAVADALARQGDADVRAAQIVHHALAANAAARALPFALLAGRQAEYCYAHKEAEDHFRLALTLARQLGDAPLELAALERLGVVLNLCGAYDEAIAISETALGHASDNLAARLRLLAVLGRAHLGRGSLPQGIARMAEGLASIDAALLAAHPYEAALLCVNLARGYMLERHTPEALAVARRARELAQRTNDAHLQGITEIRLGAIQYIFGRVAEARQITETALTHLGPLSEDTVIALANLGMFALAEGALDRYLTASQRACVVAERLGSPATLASCLGHLAKHAYISGNWAQVRPHYEKALAISRTNASAGNIIYLLAQLAHQELMEGDAASAETHFAEAQTLAQINASPAMHAVIAPFLAERDLVAGQPHQAQARLEPLCAQLGESEEWPQFWLGMAYCELGESARVEAIIARRQVHFAGGALSLFDAMRIRWLQARLAESRGAFADAIRAYDDALARADAIPFPFEKVRIVWHAGRCLLLQGDHLAARKHLTHALGLCVQLGERFYAPHIAADLALLLVAVDSIGDYRARPHAI